MVLLKRGEKIGYDDKSRYDVGGDDKSIINYTRRKAITFNEIEEIYKNSVKLNERKRKIGNRLEIDGLDLDVFFERFGAWWMERRFREKEKKEIEKVMKKRVRRID